MQCEGLVARCRRCGIGGGGLAPGWKQALRYWAGLAPGPWQALRSLGGLTPGRKQALRPWGVSHRAGGRRCGGPSGRRCGGPSAWRGRLVVTLLYRYPQLTTQLVVPHCTVAQRTKIAFGSSAYASPSGPRRSAPLRLTGAAVLGGARTGPVAGAAVFGGLAPGRRQALRPWGVSHRAGGRR